MQGGSLLAGQNSGEDGEDSTPKSSTRASWGDDVLTKKWRHHQKKVLVKSHLIEGVILVTHFQESFLCFCSDFNFYAWISQGTESSC